MVETKARMEVRRRGADKEGAISRKESGLSCHLEREKRDRAKEAYRLYPLHKEEVQEEGKERLGGYGESLLPQSLFSSLSRGVRIHAEESGGDQTKTLYLPPTLGSL